MKWNKEKYGDFRVVIWMVLGILFILVSCSKPNKNDFPKREAMLYEKLPEIRIYSTDIQLKDNLKVSTFCGTPIAEGKFEIVANEKDIVSYYEKEFLKFEWEKDGVDTHISTVTNKECRIYNYKKTGYADVGISFDIGNYKGDKMTYEIMFHGRF